MQKNHKTERKDKEERKRKKEKGTDYKGES